MEGSGAVVDYEGVEEELEIFVGRPGGGGDEKFGPSRGERLGA